MLMKLILIILICSTGYSQHQTLAIFNQSLFTQLSERKFFSGREFKSLRIRARTEVGSADDYSYKEGELLRLVEYVTFSAFISRKKEEEVLAQDLWDKFLKLPNISGLKFKVGYLKDIFIVKDKSHAGFIKLMEYVEKFAPREKKGDFFYNVFESKCRVISYIRKTKDLESCWSELRKLNDNQDLLGKLKISELVYYSSTPQFREKFYKTIDEIMSNEKYTNIFDITRRIKLFNEISEGRLENVTEKLEAIKRETLVSMSHLYLKLHIEQKKMDKALGYIREQDMAEKRTAVPQLTAYYDLAAEYYLETGDFKKSKFYFTKLDNLEDLNALQPMGDSLRLLLIEILLNKEGKLEAYSKKFDEYGKLITENSIDDPKIMSQFNLGSRLVSKKQWADLPALTKVAAEAKKHYPSKHVLNKLIDRVLIEIKSASKSQL